MSVAINILLIIASILLIVIVLMQEGNQQGLGVIGGAAETFLGKNKAKSYEGKLVMITRILAVVFVVLAVAATWLNARSYTVTYMVPTTDEDGNTTYEEYYPYAEAYAESYNYMIEAGIYDSSEYSETSYDEIVASSDAATLREYTTYKTGDDIDVYSTPTKEGYTGTWLTEDGNELPATMGHTAYTVYANYTINQYTVTVSDAGVNGDNAEPTLFTVTADYGTAIEYPETVKLPDDIEGYYISWSESLPTTIPGSDTTISVTYTAGNYISYFGEDGTEVFPYLEDYCEYVAYYQWYVALMNGDESYQTMDTDAIASDLYTQLYDQAVENDDMDSIRQFVEKDSEIDLYDTPAKEGYVGTWEGEVPETMGTERIELHATYTIGTYTVTVIDNGLDDSKKIITTEQVEVTPEPTATPEATATPAADASAEATAEATAEVTAEPTATPEPTYETVEVSSDNVLFTVTAEYGTAIEYTDAVVLPEAPEGYTVAWSTELPSTIPGKDTTISVVYTAIEEQTEETAEATAEPAAEETVEATEEPAAEATAEATEEPAAEATAEATEAPATETK